MSHIAVCDFFVTDLDALEAVCESIGLELVRGATTFKWFGRWQNDYSGREAAVTAGYDPKLFGQCEHKIRVKGASSSTYEIGLVRRIDNGDGWELLHDNWSGGYGLIDKVGVGLVKLKDAMLDHLTMMMLAADGYSLTRSIDPETGDILIDAEN